MNQFERTFRRHCDELGIRAAVGLTNENTETEQWRNRLIVVRARQAEPVTTSKPRNRRPRIFPSLMLMIAVVFLAAGCQMAPGLADTLNAGGTHTATENMAAGLPDTDVYCYQTPGAPTSPVYWPDETQWWTISSSIVTAAGSCTEAIAQATAIECISPSGPGETRCRVLSITPMGQPG